ncbi:MAG: 1-(5-phosphoribosyl)-5-[(5-phosphoribosylamino)methylideneamino]imidazole-4-carboxamide isomerase [Dehalococcoidia bacterium]|nr:1-(5-phosphoribosyl)-5-[(5-phosphoribosylamino)methylideneamino]imidazole-4-carboxamide isomerase [Dehalococcoidia bacterium]
MEVIPALDLKSGRCVRLYQGDFAQETVFSSNPLEVAQRWQAEGAGRLHIVDLDGAATGEQTNYDVIRSLVSNLRIPVQVGGGVRSRESADRLLGLGVSRVVLGTAAIEDPALVEELCRIHGGEQVVVAVDSRDGYVATRGWMEGSSVLSVDLVQSMGALGVPRFLCTDISRDGTLTHPNFESLRQLVQATSMAILASGGISSEEDIQELSGIGVEGAILGRALYTGDILLEAAIEASKPR